MLWRNVFYPTDEIGGPCDVSADKWLADRPTSLHVYGQPVPAVLTHTGYRRDPRFWTHVDAVANALVEPAGLPQPSLFDALHTRGEPIQPCGSSNLQAARNESASST